MTLNLGHAGNFLWRILGAVLAHWSRRYGITEIRTGTAPAVVPSPDVQYTVGGDAGKREITHSTRARPVLCVDLK